jgi:hypothetical protein
MDDLDFYGRLAKCNLPDDLRDELGRRQVVAARAAMQAARWRLARTEVRGEYLIGPVDAATALHSSAAGIRALSLAVLNPGRWVPLGMQRTRRAWHTALNRSLEQLAQVDLDMANALAPGESRAVGLHLRTHADGIDARWTPARGVRIEV